MNRFTVMLYVFLGCLALLAITLVMVINNYEFLWIIPYAFVMAGQWWLMNGGRWRR